MANTANEAASLRVFWMKFNCRVEVEGSKRVSAVAAVANKDSFSRGSRDL